MAACDLQDGPETFKALLGFLGENTDRRSIAVSGDGWQDFLFAVELVFQDVKWNTLGSGVKEAFKADLAASSGNVSLVAWRRFHLKWRQSGRSLPLYLKRLAVAHAQEGSPATPRTVTPPGSPEWSTSDEWGDPYKSGLEAALREMRLENKKEVLSKAGVLAPDDVDNLTEANLASLGLNMGERNRVRAWQAKRKTTSDGRPPSRQTAAASAAEYRKYTEVFRSIDDNGNGSLDFDELVEALKRLGTFTSLDAAHKLFRLADLDGNGSINLDEFVALMSSAKSGVADAAAVSELASKGQAALSGVEASTGIQVSAQEVLDAPVDRAAFEVAQGALDLDVSEDLGGDDCKLVFAFLLVDEDLVLEIVKITCAKLLADLEAALAAKGVPGLSDRVNFKAVVVDAMRWLLRGMHGISSHCDLSARDLRDNQAARARLHSVRKALCLAACYKSMEDVVKYAKVLALRTELDGESVTFRDREGDVSTIRVVDGRLEWSANGRVYAHQLRHLVVGLVADGQVVVSSPDHDELNAFLRAPAPGPQRIRMLEKLALMAKALDVAFRTVKIPVAQLAGSGRGKDIGERIEDLGEGLEALGEGLESVGEGLESFGEGLEGFGEGLGLVGEGLGAESVMESAPLLLDGIAAAAGAGCSIM